MLSLLVASLWKHRDYFLHDLTAIYNEKNKYPPPLFSRSLILLLSLYPTVRWLHSSHHLCGSADADTLSLSTADRNAILVDDS